MDVASWLEWIRRAVLRDRWSRELRAEPDAPVPAWEDDWVEAVCSGVLEQYGVALAERVAALQRYEGEAAKAGEIAALQAALDRLCAEAVTPAALQREVAARWLEWTRADCRCVVAPEQDVAKELVLCIREHRRDLAGVAADAGLQVQERSWYVGDAAAIGETRAGRFVLPHDDLAALDVDHAQAARATRARASAGSGVGVTQCQQDRMPLEHTEGNPFDVERLASLRFTARGSTSLICHRRAQPAYGDHGCVAACAARSMWPMRSCISSKGALDNRVRSCL